jgi:prevent-host-death family protein
MRTVDIRTAKTHLSRLVEEAAAGEEIVITKGGKPLARLCPLAPAPRKRVLGRLEGKLAVPENFDRLYDDEIRELFEKRAANAHLHCAEPRFSGMPEVPVMFFKPRGAVPISSSLRGDL